MKIRKAYMAALAALSVTISTNAHADLTYTAGSGFTGNLQILTLELDSNNRRALIYVSEVSGAMYTGTCPNVTSNTAFRYVQLPATNPLFQDMLSLLLGAHLAGRKVHFMVDNSCGLNGQPVITWVSVQ